MKEGERHFRHRIAADLAELSRTRALMAEVGRAAGLPEGRVFDLQVAVSEAVANAIEHAASDVEIETWLLPDRLIVEISNDGVFRPGLSRGDESRPRGLGLPLMVSLANDVHVTRESGGRTRFSLTFLLAAKDDGDSFRPQEGPASVLQRLQAESLKAAAASSRADLLAELVEHSSQPFGVGLADGRLAIANSAYAELLGYTKEEFVELDWAKDITPPDSWKLEEKKLAELTSSETAVRYEKEYLRKDGSRVPVELLVHARRDPEGAILYYYAFVTDLSERKQAERERTLERDRLRQKEEEARHLIRYAPTSVYEVDFRHRRFISVNDRMCEQTGYSREELLAMDPSDLLEEESRIRFAQRIQRALAGQTPDDVVEYRVKVKDGREVWAVLNVSLIQEEGGGVRALVVGHDVTERKRAEAQQLRLNRVLRALSESNQALVRASDESAYLNEACRVVVEDCGHAMVWIGYAEQDEGKRVRPVASAGFEEGYLESLNVSWADTERGRGPTGTAVRTGKPSMCRDMLTDSTFLPWREEALARGYASSIALPLTAGGLPLGALTIYSVEPDPFSDEEIRLLTNLAGDIARGITALRLRAAEVRAEEERKRLLMQEHALAVAARDVAERRMAEEAAKRASRYNRSLLEAALDPLVTIGPDGTITDVNEATVNITGRARGELIGTDFSDYFTDPEAARRGYLEVFAEGAVTDYPLTIRARDGKLTDVLYNASVYRDEAGAVLGVFAAARDLTAMKQLEEQRVIASRLQQALLDIPQQAGGVRFGHLYRSATHQAQVGGDFYDVFEAKGGHIALLIGDVSGHGLEAARIATLVKDVVHAFAHQFRRPHLVLRETNRLLVEKRLSGFVTAFLGLLDPVSGTLVYSAAGHPPSLLATDGRVEPLDSVGSPLGVFADARYKDVEIDIQKDALLLLYTDGITEARRDGVLFGEQRLAEALGRLADRPVEELPALLLDEALGFSGGALSDDVALLAVSYLGGEGSATG